MDALADKPQKKFYLETFGCQMNVHDSEKVVGTLVQEGYQQVETVEQADLILYNTCSIRDKAEQRCSIVSPTTRNSRHRERNSESLVASPNRKAKRFSSAPRTCR